MITTTTLLLLPIIYLEKKRFSVYLELFQHPFCHENAKIFHNFPCVAPVYYLLQKNASWHMQAISADTISHQRLWGITSGMQ